LHADLLFLLADFEMPIEPEFLFHCDLNHPWMAFQPTGCGAAADRAGTFYICANFQSESANP